MIEQVWLGQRRSRERIVTLGEELAFAVLDAWLDKDQPTPRDKARELCAVARRLCRSHGIVTHVLGRFPERPTIVVSNHLSYLDPLVIASMLPCAPIAKIEALGWPVIGRAMRDLGVNFVDRGDAMSGALTLRRSLRALQAGVSVLNFAEGTTSYGDTVLPFHVGVFGLARLANVPVTPVALRLSSRDLCWVGNEGFLPHYLRISTRQQQVVHAAVGEPMFPRRFGGDRAMADATRDEIAELMACW